MNSINLFPFPFGAGVRHAPAPHERRMNEKRLYVVSATYWPFKAYEILYVVVLQVRLRKVATRI